ncbi:DUF4230 domain-containing protein [Fulvivirgaceae bacterium BMA12]|uniref:DUF4230 domain-containing protein n=1 Tax=Agaribacillus aureus TaxID=3051825 RepID=A0ABT8L1P2_9BACT|nr:DUF4230 domain-containing protein [Fulvivirgaceae bacterium BMA12]
MRWVKNSVLLTAIALSINACNTGPDRAFVISKIKNVAKLATTETVVNKKIMAVKDKRILFVIKVNSATFMADTEATIKTGIDLSRITSDDVEINGKQIKLKVPPIELLNFSYPAEKFVVDQENTDSKKLFNKISTTEIDEFYQKGEMEIRSSLQYLGIIEATKKNTRIFLEGLLGNIGFEEIDIIFNPQHELAIRELVVNENNFEEN